MKIDLFNTTQAIRFNKYDEKSCLSLNSQGYPLNSSYIYVNPIILKYIDENTDFKETNRENDMLEIKSMIKSICVCNICKISHERNVENNFKLINTIIDDILSEEKMLLIHYLSSEIRKPFSIFFRIHLNEQINYLFFNLYNTFYKNCTDFFAITKTLLEKKTISRKFQSQIDTEKIIGILKEQLEKFDIQTSPISLLDVQNFSFDELYTQIFEKSNVPFFTSKEERENEFKNIKDILIGSIIFFTDQFLSWKKKFSEQIPIEMEKIYEDYTQIKKPRENKILEEITFLSLHNILEEIYLKFIEKTKGQGLPQKYDKNEFDRMLHNCLKNN